MIENIYIKSIGEVDNDMIQHLQKELAGIFYRDVSIAEHLPVPPKSYDSSRQQYLSTELLKTILNSIAKEEDDTDDTPSKVIGITEVDLFVPIFTYVFGEAQLNGKAAVISLHRLRPDYYESLQDSGFVAQPPHNAGKDLYRLRALKEAVHELGHAFGLTHCSQEKCVMNFANNVVQVDLKEQYFCANCSDMVKRS